MVKPEECLVCKHPERKELENECLRGKITKRDMAQIANCRVDDVWEHMTSHIVKNNSLVNLDDKRNVLLDSVNKLRESFDHVAETKNYGPIMTRQLTELAKELRQTIAGLAELEGNMRKEQHITIQQYNDFRSVVIAQITKLCPACQQVLMEELEKAQNAEKPPIIEAEYRDKSV
jgi:hypothetical protein